ncbi:hypothetical protein chiPu_0024115 [Chiloscyllium punctatum]|uniref:Uncharacterized protein n=1 Tax=Chiloscyllium punctatum TaxID=137246 RepID=A0A401TC57_CHIPU|nr:hypothetical protein [Chiloscyllium punctatum]
MCGETEEEADLGSFTPPLLGPETGPGLLSKETPKTEQAPRGDPSGRGEPRVPRAARAGGAGPKLPGATQSTGRACGANASGCWRSVGGANARGKSGGSEGRCLAKGFESVSARLDRSWLRGGRKKVEGRELGEGRTEERKKESVLNEDVFTSPTAIRVGVHNQ